MLTAHRALALMAGGGWVFNVRRVCRTRLFFYLEEERIVFIVAEQKDHIGEGADAASAHNFEADVYGAITVGQELMVGRERSRVVFERVKHKGPGLAVNFPKRVRLYAKAQSVRRFVRQLFHIGERRGAFRLLQRRSDKGIAKIAGDAVARDIQRGHRRKAANPGAVLAREV